VQHRARYRNTPHEFATVRPTNGGIGKTGHPQPVWRAIQNLLLRWIPDETKRRRVPVDNPIHLYGFPSVAWLRFPRARISIALVWH
jgi:hypothetical protein